MKKSAAQHQKLVVVLNGDAIVEYDRGKRLPKQQREYLDRMDRHMDDGISIGSTTIETPDIVQKATFVANNLIEALRADNEPVMAAACAYLANRLPDLKQVKAEEHNEQTTVELVFDKQYSPEVQVKFT